MVHLRNEVINLCHVLFNDSNYTVLYDTIMCVYKKAVPKLEQRINNLVELISELKDRTTDDVDDVMETNEDEIGTKITTSSSSSTLSKQTLNIKVNYTRR